jgi:hypothetical protein
VDRGPLAGPLARHFPAIEPGPDGAITIWYVSSRFAQTALAAPLPRGETAATVDDAAGFAPGSTAIVFDADGCHDAVRVEDAAAATILLRAGSRRCDYARGAAFAQAEVRTYRVERPARRLVRRDEATGLTVPVVDGIRSMSVEYLDGGRRARIVLRVTSAADPPAGPDLSVTFDVLAGNLWLS